jgi:hypothetical protein
VTTTAHTYIRCGTRIFAGDANDNWRELHNFESAKRARRWERDQEKKRPGSVTVGSPPQKLVNQQADLEVRRHLARKIEIARLVREQARDQARNPSPRPKTLSLSGKTAELARAYVAPDRDASSFLRERSKKRQTSRNARNTRATYGAS